MRSGGIPDDKDLEIARLRQGINDLVGLLALSATWTGMTPSEIARTLGEALFALLRLDFIFIALDGKGGAPVHEYADVRAELLSADAVDLGQELRKALGEQTHDWPAASRRELLGATVSIATLRLGLGRDFGTIVAGTRRPDFPTEPERLLLSVARNQALLTLQECEVQREQRALAGELSATALVEGIPGFVAVLAPDGSVRRVNRQIEDYCGQPLAELQHWGTNGIVHPDDMPHVAQIFGASIASGQPYDIEQRLRRFDGAYRWFENRGRPLLDASGAVLAWHVLLTDVDDRKRAEEAVRASERNLRQQSEAFPQMLWSATADGNIDYCNERLLAYSGLTAAEVTDDRWVNLLHPDDRAPTADIWLRCVATGESYRVEVRQFHIADRSYRWTLTTALPLRDGAGRIVKWYGSCVDIHDRKLAEERLRASEQYLASLIDTIPAYVFSAAPDGAVNYINPQLREWFGRSDEKILAAEWVHLTHPDDREGTVADWLGAVEAGLPYRREVRFMHRGGEYRWCDNQARPLRDKDGTILAWHGVVNDVHDRRLAEQALAASERNLKLTIDTIPALAWSANADGTADFFSQTYLDYVGKARDGLTDWQWTSLVHPDDLEPLGNVWEACRAMGEGAEVEARLKGRDGAYRWFLFKTRPLRDEHGAVLKWYGVNTDIEDRKRAEQELASRERTLREAHDHLAQAQRLSHTGSFTTDVLADTHIWSDELYRVLEYEAGETPTFRAFRERIHPDDGARFDAGFKRSLAEQTEFDETFRIVTPRGNIKHLHAVAHFVPGGGGRPVVIGSIQDVTELRAREDELRQSAHFLAVGERVSLTGSFAWDMETDRIAMSEQLRLLHELDEGAELTGPDFRKRIHPDDLALFDEKSAELASGRDSIEYEFRLITAKGRLKYIRAFVQMLQQPDGPLQRVGAVQDVTQRRIAEEALDRARSELAHVTRVMSLGALTASIAHEVNQPLAGIITNASTCLRMLAADPPDIGGALETARRTIRDGNRAAEVVKRLRTLFGRKEFAAEAVDLNEAAREVIALSAQELQRRGISVRTKLDEALPPVLGDRVQLQQVIVNLVLNAADAMTDVGDRPRQITLATGREAPDLARLTLSDSGRGIGEEDLGRIFEAFYTTKADGMGIGLSVSRSIIERHEGRIWAAANDGPGATFAFSVPFARADERAG